MSQLPEGLINTIICGDALKALKTLPEESVDCVVTSPPYWRLRDYGVAGQLGQESTFTGYIEHLSAVFDEVKRVLKETGTCWVVLGDVYTNKDGARRREGLPPKCLLQLPARLGVEMVNRGWTLRNEIIWHKPNRLPESVRDRFTMDFEKVLFLTKASRYYFRQQYEPLRDKKRPLRRLINPESKRKYIYNEQKQNGVSGMAAINPQTAEASRLRMLLRGRQKRSVWTVAPARFRGEHYATFPAALIETPILAGCPPNGIVLDPFMGSGTTALVAKRLGRRFLGIELNSKYVRMANKRLRDAKL